MSILIIILIIIHFFFYINRSTPEEEKEKGRRNEGDEEERREGKREEKRGIEEESADQLKEGSTAKDQMYVYRVNGVLKPDALQEDLDRMLKTAYLKGYCKVLRCNMHSRAKVICEEAVLEATTTIIMPCFAALEDADIVENVVKYTAASVVLLK